MFPDYDAFLKELRQMRQKEAQFLADARFENLTENTIAIQRAKALAQGNPSAPLVILGPAASGKTRLLHAIANQISENGQNNTVFYMGNALVGKLASVLRNGTSDQFREELTAYAVVLFDDIDVFERFPKPAQELFLSLVRELSEHRRSFAMAGNPDRMPTLLTKLKLILPEEDFIQNGFQGQF